MNSRTNQPETESGFAAECIERICRADGQALTELFDHLGSRVFGAALSIVHDPDDAEEVTNEVFDRVWRTAETFDPARGTAPAWIFAITRSRALDLLRREGRHRRRQVHPESGLDTYPNQPDDDPEVLGSRLEFGAAARDALAALSSGQRQVVDLAFFQDLSHAEISRKLRMPLGTVKSHCRRGVNLMRSALESFKPART